MKRIVMLLVLMPCLLGACISVDPLTAYESDELVAVKHNQNSDCTLLIYRNPMGQTRHVFRKHGVFEFGLVFWPDGGISLKERGRLERDIEAFEASRVTQRINSMLDMKQGQQGPEQYSKSTI